MRHAKAENDETGKLADFDRSLTKRGEDDAKQMAQELKNAGFKPSMIIASPAKRTRKTAKIVAETLGLKPANIEFDSMLYNAGYPDFMHVIHELSDQYQSVMIIGHNPSLTGMVGYLTNSFAEHVPTSGIVVAETDSNSWKAVTANQGRVIWSGCPKEKSIPMH